MSVLGVDLSSNNGPSHDFKRAYREGVRFVLIKVSEGTNYVNPRAARHAREAKAAGLLVGAYAFLRPSTEHTAEEEAEYFFRHAREAGLLERGCLRPTLDIEVTGLVAGRPSRRYDYRVIERLIKLMGPHGKRPFIYTGSWFWDGVLGARNAHKCPLWLAAYVSNYKRFIPRGFRRVSIWQYTDKATIPGFSGKVDADRYLGKDVHALRAAHCLKADH